MSFNIINTSIQPDYETSRKCDCCGMRLDPDRDTPEYQESLHIRYHAGPSSRIIEDGSLVECVLCQTCTHEILGHFLRITPNHSNSEAPYGIAWSDVQQVYYSILEFLRQEREKYERAH